tara:strand:+ start:653 stop:1099 length:447 start_codon:yes stop_codon:yes gene_type:complete
MQADPLNKPVFFSHGTLQVGDPSKTLTFYRDFLGIGCRRHHTAALSAFHGGLWMIACVIAGKGLHRQGPENRWLLDMDTADSVGEARAEALTYQDHFGIRTVTDLTPTDDGGISFMIEDIDSNWWEVLHRPGKTGRWVDEAFARGDVC